MNSLNKTITQLAEQFTEVTNRIVNDLVGMYLRNGNLYWVHINQLGNYEGIHINQYGKYYPAIELDKKDVILYPSGLNHSQLHNTQENSTYMSVWFKTNVYPEMLKQIKEVNHYEIEKYDEEFKRTIKNYFSYNPHNFNITS